MAFTITPSNTRTSLAASTATEVAAAPASNGHWEGHVSFTNRGVVARKVRLFVDTENSASAADYLIYDMPLKRGRRAGTGPIILTAGQKLYARADGVDISVFTEGKAYTQ